MFQDPNPEVVTSATFPLPSYGQEIVRHILLGDRRAVEEAIHRLSSTGYCDRIEWSRPVPVQPNTPSFEAFLQAVEETGSRGGVISLMTRRRGVSQG
ncbi:MAG: hypothetical protein HC929_16540 [Leptolyngbyaceae cyanobacterium SM2_5_2]|nr:hypothetical protein [Leptolyngbyaceae cyanobacterium SM2_5_2]